MSPRRADHSPRRRPHQLLRSASSGATTLQLPVVARRTAVLPLRVEVPSSVPALASLLPPPNDGQWSDSDDDSISAAVRTGGRIVLGGGGWGDAGEK
eukprot:scaffold6054_cov67-Isochrysis_galbana.AAC.1